MHRLRTTFTRSRTPTGAEMKTQNSLEVPKQVRSASFDEMQLEAQRAAAHLLKQQSSSSTDDRSDAGFLQVPQVQSQRSHSFDSAGSDDSGTFLEVPRRIKQRRASSTKTPPPCIHCLYLEEYEKQVSAEQRFFIDHHELKSLSYSSSESDDEQLALTSEDEGVDEENGSPQFGNTLLPPHSVATPCSITFTLSPTNGDCALYPFPIGSPPASPLYPQSPSIELPPSPPPPADYLPISPSVELSLPIGEEETVPLPSCELSPASSCIPPIATIEPTPPLGGRARRRSISRQEAIFVEPTGNSLENVSSEENKVLTSHDDDTDKTELPSTPLVVRDIYLTVPDLKRDRAASVDSCFSKLPSSGKTEELQPSDGCFLDVPNINATRSRSVDIVLPTDEQARYKALALSGSAGIYGKSSSGGKARQIRIVPDWSENAIQGEHFWKPTSVSGDLCCAGEDCRKNGQRMKCSACQLIAHMNCIPAVYAKTQLACKPTFREVGVRQYREQTTTHHHWVHRRTEKGKCKQCGKAVQGKLFGSKEIVALSCAWCKNVYHNKESCFNQERIGEECSLGTQSNIVVPPSWIVKLPNKGSFKSSLRTNKRKPASKKKNPKEQKEPKTFIVKPIPSANVTPVIVFINPKSGGNQGVKLLGKFQWILNPRQVFDLTQGGPKMGLELFRKAPQLRVLACGGDGTAGWVLSVLDQLNFQPPPAVGVLPLGTGNDLARALGWGGGYTDEPVGKILDDIGKSDTILLDRWSVKVTPNEEAEPTTKGKDNLPLNVVNNYFSFGVDAHIALEFHEAREAHPERFNSRLKNKMYYGQMGGKDLVQRKYRNLADVVKLECDGQDFTPKLKRHGVHAILFLNIPSYGGGTHPWNNSFGQSIPSTDDGLIEVVGLTTYQLPLLQAGAHGTCICQCKTAKIVTYKTIPMQVDGEACRVKPSIIELELLNKAVMLAKRKPGRANVQMAGLEPQTLNILRITMPNYEQYHYEKDMLKKTAVNLGTIAIEPTADLELMRNIINKFFEESSSYPKMSQDWCFVDSCTAERFFRIDRAQEHLHYITDIASGDIYVLDQECATMPQTPDQERNFAAYQQRQEQRSNDRTLGPNATTGKRANDNKSDKPFRPKRRLEKTSDAVLIAAKTGDINLLRGLHEQGYSLLSVDVIGQTALHYATEFNHKDIIKYLISCAPFSLINMVEETKGRTALHLAAAKKRRDISVMLVAAGATLSIIDKTGNTPMMLAFNSEAHDLATYLESQERFLRMNLQEKI